MINTLNIQQYILDHTEGESELLKRIVRETHLHRVNPNMLSGHFQGRLLSLFSHIINPKFVLEIGTFTGYATLCLAEGLQKEGKLITIDSNEELFETVQSYFDSSSFSKNIDMLTGNAVEIIPKLTHPWDLVFIDADKFNYINYYEMVIEQTNKNGYIIADNALWDGKVLEKTGDKDTEGIKIFNERVHKDTRVQNVLLPIRDGLMVLRKK